MLSGPPSDPVRFSGAMSQLPPTEPRPAGQNGHAQPGLRPLITSSPAEWDATAVPERKWHVTNWLPQGRPSALYGDGGVGKTLAAQQLITSTVTGRPWFGLEVQKSPALGIFCEDDLDELHIRQADINAALGVAMNALAAMRIASRVGDENLLMTFDREGIGAVTEFFSQVLDAAKAMRAGLVVVDTAADTFGGNENIRPQVRQFVSGCLGRLARDTGATVLLCAHPSVAGLVSGQGTGGSTAWSNSVRSRLYLEREPAASGGPVAPDENIRILSRKKANYSSIGESIRLRWCQGALVLDGTKDGILGSITRKAVDETFLAILNRLNDQEFNVSPKKNAGNYAPVLFAKQPDRDGYDARAFEGAMYRLLNQKRIMVESYGRKGDERQRIVRSAP